MTRLSLSVSIFLLLLLRGFVSNEVQSLYEDDDPMIQFTNDTIFEHLSPSSGNNKLWVVEFYSSWCGHCQVYAPKWRRLTYELKNWRKYVSVGVMNCAAERNLDTCSKFKVDMYPTIRFFKPGWKKPNGADEKEKSNWGEQYSGDLKLRDVRRGIVDRIEELNIPGYPKPNFDLITKELIKQYLRQSRLGESTYRYLALVFEEADSYTGKILTLDADGCRTVAVRRVSHINTEITAEYNVVAFPSVVVISLSNNQYKELSKDDRTYEGFMKALNQITEVVEEPPQLKEKSGIVDELQREKAANRSSDVYMIDLLSAIAFTLRREIPKVSEEIKDDAFLAMKNWINLLAKCFPGERHTKTYLNKLDKWVQGRSKSYMKTADLLAVLETIADHDSYLPSKVKYHACQGSSTKYRGFPCTLWVLFHTLTVNCDEKGSGITGIEILKRIRNFVDYFFGCRYCRDHFVEMSKNIENEVKTQDEAILWLWSRHNMVNARLKKAQSSDPNFPKIQFPEDNMCGECRKPTNLANTLLINPGYDVEATKWNKKVIVQFLKEHYGIDNIRINLKENQPATENDADRNAVRRKFNYLYYSKSASSPSFPTIGLSQLDMSMCLLLYVSVIVIMIGLYIYFIRRRRVKQLKYYA